jgi:hypothetical protein
MPEMGACGEAKVLATLPCPPIEPGPGRIVTGLFRHRWGLVCHLHIEGEPGPIGITAGHPVGSADRDDWVAAGALRLGERVLVEGGTAAVLGFAEASGEPDHLE